MSMRHRSRSTLVAACLAIGSATCTGKIVPTGGLFLMMCTDGTPRPDSLRLVVQSADGSKKYRDKKYDLGSPELPRLPATLAIQSNGDPATSVLIDVGVWKGDEPIDVRHYEVSRIPTDRVVELDVIFTESCRPASSAGGTCESSKKRGDALPPYAGNAGASAKCHAPLDDGGDAASDATDAAVDDAVPDASVPADAGILDAVSSNDRLSEDSPADVGNELDAQVEVDAEAPCPVGAKRCQGNIPQTCDPTGQWQSAQCFQGLTHCSDGECVTVPPSCLTGPPGAGFDCSSAGTGDCCASYDVQGGTFFRDYDGVKYPDRSHAATVSSFRLDAFEITVGRFRQFVRAVVGGWRPDPGSGKHAHLRQGGGLVDVGEGGMTLESGWQASWTPNLPTTVASWSDHLTCGAETATWTPNAGVANEKLPITCINWYDAQAFCIWDGGFLPSTAEWNYAAAGGSDQRVYAWGNVDPQEDTALAIWGCHYGGGFCRGIVNVAPVGSARGGDAKWGQSDLTGSVWEWVFDFEAAYVEPCVDCAATSGLGHVVRGASFMNYPENLPISYHEWSRSAHQNVGARCARVIP